MKIAGFLLMMAGGIVNLSFAFHTGNPVWFINLILGLAGIFFAFLIVTEE